MTPTARVLAGYAFNSPPVQAAERRVEFTAEEHADFVFEIFALPAVPSIVLRTDGPQLHVDWWLDAVLWMPFVLAGLTITALLAWALRSSGRARAAQASARSVVRWWAWAALPWLTLAAVMLLAPANDRVVVLHPGWAVVIVPALASLLALLVGGPLTALALTVTWLAGRRSPPPAPPASDGVSA